MSGTDKSIMNSPLRLHPLATIFVGLMTLMASCQPGDRSVIVDNSLPIIDPKVQNGTAYDQATVDVGENLTVVLPDDAIIQRTAGSLKLRLYMAKDLSWAGHPPDNVSVIDQRKRMGCAIRKERDTLVVATFGEWDSHIEGGAGMKLVALVPQSITLQQRKGLSGPESVANGDRANRTTSPSEGWTIVADTPDTHRSADKYSAAPGAAEQVP